LWFFLGFAPQYTSRTRVVDFSNTTNTTNLAIGSLGRQFFNQDHQQYFSTFRLDGTVTQKIRVFGSWLYQYSRESGDSLPNPDSANGLPNTGGQVIGQGPVTGIDAPITQYARGLGFSNPNATFNVGADITLTNLGTNVTQNVKSGSDGEYRFALVPPGMYRLNVKGHGFAEKEVKDLKVDPSQEVPVNVTLGVASSTTTVHLPA